MSGHVVDSPPAAAAATLNAIWVKSAYARLRPRAMLAWLVIVLSVAAFLYLVVYLVTAEHRYLQHEQAAKTALLPLIILQAFILMVMGTATVASGFARERGAELLDYHRLTPMSPSSKILGFLFGLPVREYLLFALTLPFVGYAAMRGDLSPWKLLLFYAVFFCSTWVYHMTALVAAMCVKRPWSAQAITLGMVAGLYLVLPQLGRIGFTIFEFLTVRPTFYGMVAGEVSDVTARRNPFFEYQIQRWQQVEFFNLSLSPVLFSLLVEGFVLLSLFLVVHRKWRNEQHHPFPKLYAIFCGLVVHVVLVGSIWPFITRLEKYNLLYGRMRGALRLDSSMHALLLILFVLLAVCGVGGGVLIQLVSPTIQTMRSGLRRARKIGSRRLSFNSDAASALPVALAVSGLTFVSYSAILAVASHSSLFDMQPTSWLAHWAPPLLIGLLLMFVFLLSELLGVKVMAFTLFVLWMIPFFVQVILLGAFGREVLAVYVGLTSPFLDLYLVCANFVEHAHTGDAVTLDIMPASWRTGIDAMILSMLSLYAAAVLALGGLWWRRHTNLRRVELG
ncbi:MAG: hypothetical protein IT445_08505 [Phycisphaeraceae bacterium]|nr:hypothetical protein [Phycisphaeraceae bacterium]